MRKQLSDLAIGALFLAIGCLDVYRGIAPLFQGAARLANDDLLVLAIGLAALLGGAFLLRGADWARWLLAGWIAFHVIVSIGHPPFQLVAHVLIFGTITYLLFRTKRSRAKRADRTSA